MFVFKAGVVGAGVMGGEIAQVIAAAGVPVVLKDVDSKFVDAGLEKAREVTEGQIGKLVSKGKISEEDASAQAERILSRITGTTSYDGFGDVDFVIEAVPEKMEIKHAVFADLDAATPGHAILASNTSGLSITEIGDITNRPDKVVGFHFFWPASFMRLVEVIEGEDTSPETAQAAANFAQQIKKMPIRCGECPGFVVNRILISMASEFWRYQDETGVPVEAIDQAIADAKVAPMGPFRLADMTGLDTTVKVARDMREAYGDRMYVHRAMEELVAQGRLGAKTGQGFYPYPQPDPGYEQAPVKLDTRGDVAIVWLDNPPANGIGPEVMDGLQKAWAAIEGNTSIRTMILTSPNPALFSAGADIKGFAKMDAAGGEAHLDRAHDLLRSWERSRVM